MTVGVALGLGGQRLDLEFAAIDGAGEGDLTLAALVAEGLLEQTLLFDLVLDLIAGIVVCLDGEDVPIWHFDGVEMTVGMVFVLNIGRQIRAVDDLVLAEFARCSEVRRL